jgi:hypothetical protein
MKTIIILLVVAIAAILLWRRYDRVKENRHYYEDYYDWLKDRVYTYEINEYNYKYLKKQLMFLGQMQYRDREKTSVLTVEFFKRFLYYRNQEISQALQEFSVNE